MLPLALVAQPPKTNIYSFQFIQVNDTTYDVHSPKLLSNFNPDGYNNQPHFIAHNQLLFTSQKPDASTTDIYSLDLAKNYVKRVTETKLAEYSPTLMPDKSSFSVVRVEEDGWQTLWQYDQSEKRVFQNLFPNFRDNIGYHAWLNDSLVALFVLGDPPTLRIGNVRSKIVSTLSSEIGRCLKTTPDGNLLFIHKFSDQYWYLKKLNPHTKQIEIIEEFPVGYQDFELMENNKVIIGQESNLLVYDMDQKIWFPAGDLSVYGISNITRLAFNRDTLVLITTE